MVKIAVVVLLGRWLDLYIMIFPVTGGSTPVIGIWEIAAAGLMIGAFGWLFFRNFSSAASVPKSDPLLSESLHYHC